MRLMPLEGAWQFACLECGRTTGANVGVRGPEEYVFVQRELLLVCCGKLVYADLRNRLLLRRQAVHETQSDLA
jgi:hypothetical protein